MLYTRLYTDELPVIKPNTLYIITNDGTIYMQGFGVICKYESGDIAEKAMETPHIVERFAKELLKMNNYENDFDRFRSKYRK